MGESPSTHHAITAKSIREWFIVEKPFLQCSAPVLWFLPDGKKIRQRGIFSL